VQKKLTITVSEEIYDGLHNSIGRGNISRFIEDLLRPHVVGRALDAAYKELAADRVGEEEAFYWVEGTTGDVPDESR
jgi:hypothetical protein